MRCLSGDKRCRVQVHRGSLQCALAVQCLATLESVLNRRPSRRASYPCPTQARRCRWLCSSNRSGLRGLKGLAPGIASIAEEVIPRDQTETSEFYARLLPDLGLGGLVSSGAPTEATVGVFFLCVPKKQGNQKLSFDTRRVTQHFRRPWHCVLLAPASWAASLLASDSTYPQSASFAKATLDAAGLQCHEVEAVASMHVLAHLQLDHKNGVLSLVASCTWDLPLRTDSDGSRQCYHLSLLQPCRFFVAVATNAPVDHMEAWESRARLCSSGCGSGW